MTALARPAKILIPAKSRSPPSPRRIRSSAAATASRRSRLQLSDAAAVRGILFASYSIRAGYTFDPLDAIAQRRSL
jgi:hypothetical protein